MKVKDKIKKKHFLIIILLIIAISSIILSIALLVNRRANAKPEGIPFLSISDQIADSVISILSLDQKLDFLLFNNNSEFMKDRDSSLNYKFPPADTLIGKDIRKINKLSPVQFLPILTGSNYFNEIYGGRYLSSITDSSFIIDYFENGIHNQMKRNHFIYTSLDDYAVKSLPDSIYSEFYFKRLRVATSIFRNKSRILGFQISYNSYLSIDSLNAKLPELMSGFYSFLKNEIDFVLLDGYSATNVIPSGFKGISAVKLVPNNFKDDQSIIEIFNREINVFVIQEEEYTQIRNRFAKLLKTGKINVLKLNQKLRKIVKAKIWQSLSEQNSSNLDFRKENVWHQQLVERSICLLNNFDSLIPIKKTEDLNFKVVWIGKSIQRDFMKYCNMYVPVTGTLINYKDSNWLKHPGKTSKKNMIILVLDSLIKDSVNKTKLDVLLKSFYKSHLVIINFENYKNLNCIPDSLVCLQVQSRSDDDYKFAAQAVFGGIPLLGQLPHNMNEHYRFNSYHQSPKIRIKYGLAGDVGIDESKLKLIDKIATEGISMGAYPGCQIFIVKNGEVIYDKCFGYHTYSKETIVKPDDVYDLASVTKIASTTLAAMKMISDRKMSLNDQLGKFFKNKEIDYTRIKSDTIVKIDTFMNSGIKNWKVFLKQNDTININDSCFVTIDTVISKLTPKLNIFNVPLIDLLKHKSGIIPATPIFRYIYFREYYIKQLSKTYSGTSKKYNPLKEFMNFELPPSFPDNTNLPDSLKQIINLGFKKLYQEYFSRQFIKDSSDKIRLTESLYLKNKYFDTIWRDTKELPVFSKKIFQYSDVNMILLQLAIDSLNQLSIDEYMKKYFYNSLGIRNITYLPLRFYPKNRIVPTEIDDSWRFGYLHGYVHDPSSALMGGMVGNAGLYSNAHDLGILFQMVLNNGSYGGTQYIKPSVIHTFTQRNDDTQRGLGFDMPNLKAAIGTMAPESSYGHTGYTGTCVWVDPENQLVYVFLSNRNHPNSKNWRLNSYRIRERIHDAIYNSMINKRNEREK